MRRRSTFNIPHVHLFFKSPGTAVDLFRANSQLLTLLTGGVTRLLSFRSPKQ